MRNCDIKIIIDNANTISLVNDYNIHLLESPATIVAPIRDYDIQSYPETAKAEIDTRTVLKPFDYRLLLGCSTNIENINQKIQSLFNMLFSHNGTDVMGAKEIEIINEYKGIKMKGYVKQWDGKTTTINEPYSFYSFELILYVNDPNTLLSYVAPI
ncbi:MAG: hypothetical protein RRY36_09125 [Bacteroidaceae bacterium]